MPQNLEALADLEWLLRDRGEVPAVSDAERRAAGDVFAKAGIAAAEARGALDGDPGLRQRVAVAWLGAVRAHQPELPGHWIGRGLWLSGWALLVLGLVLGTGSAKALLAYDGSVPVNVLPFASLFFGLQIVLLVAMLVFVLGARMPGRGPGLLHRPIAWLAGKLGGRAQEVRAALRQLHGRHGLYADVERWTLFALAQRFGLAFNVGALLATLHTIAFTDLQFAWSTTLHLEPGTVHAFAQALALPWAWWSDAVPSLDVVAASQWARMPGRYLTDTAPEQALLLAAQWWRFCVAGLVAYGLLPRALALVAGSLAARRALARCGCDHAGFQELFDRLLPRPSGWEGPDPAAVRGAPPAEPTRERVPPPSPRGAAAVVVWGSLARRADAVRTELGRRTGSAIGTFASAGGASLAADDEAIARLAATADGRIVLAVAAGHQPTGDVLGFLRRLRAAVGRTRPVLVALLEPAADGGLGDAEADECASWRRSLGSLDDPYLWVDGARSPA